MIRVQKENIQPRWEPPVHLLVKRVLRGVIALEDPDKQRCVRRERIRVQVHLAVPSALREEHQWRDPLVHIVVERVQRELIVLKKEPVLR